MREVLGPDYQAGDLVASDYFAQRSLWDLQAEPSGWTIGLADLLDDRWGGSGITNELFDMDEYALPQRWAECFHGAGWEGLRGRLRHLLNPARFGAALFGDSGPQTGEARFKAPTKRDISEATLDKFSTETGINVEDPPLAASALHVVS